MVNIQSFSQTAGQLVCAVVVFIPSCIKTHCAKRAVARQDVSSGGHRLRVFTELRRVLCHTWEFSWKGNSRHPTSEMNTDHMAGDVPGSEAWGVRVNHVPNSPASDYTFSGMAWWEWHVLLSWFCYLQGFYEPPSRPPTGVSWFKRGGDLCLACWRAQTYEAVKGRWWSNLLVFLLLINSLLLFIYLNVRLKLVWFVLNLEKRKRKWRIWPWTQWTIKSF